MASLYNVPPPYTYKYQRDYFSKFEDQMSAINRSSTLYVGNLAFFTREIAIYELFSGVSAVKTVIMGLNKFTKQPCGFCFVEFYSHAAAETAMRTLTGARLDKRAISMELDWGFSEGRQYGKGGNGGQVRDNVAKRGHDGDRDRDTRIFSLIGEDRPRKRSHFQDGGMRRNYR